MLLLLLAIAPPFAGADACATCHPAVARIQKTSRHAAALRPAGPSLAALLGDRPLRERSGIAFSYASAAPDGVKVAITKGSAQFAALLEWAFGAGAQAITPVGRVNGRYFEHRLSWYREAGHAARTLGHPGDSSVNPERALGLVQDAATITRCFGCHATGVAPGPRLDNMQPGVTCERCHGPGADHAARPERSNISVLTGLSAKAVVGVCAECHRSPTGAPAAGDPANVRFQPVGLSASKCFEASGALSCVTCHDPHGDAIQDTARYVRVCLGCHSMPSPPASTACRRASRENCIPCHMPRRSPFQFLSFTDHRIGVHRTGP